MKLDPYFMPYTKMNSSLNLNLNLSLSTKTIKLFKENIGDNFHDIGFSSDSLEVASKTQAIKGKIDKLGLHQT